MFQKDGASGGTDATALGLATALRDRTREAHTKAERHPVQSRMARGVITREEYAAYLGQLLHVWNEIDDGLARGAKRDPRIGAMVQEYHPHAWRVRSDLRFYGRGEAAPLDVTRRMMEMVRAAGDCAAIVGVWYVLEGSANGGRYIAKSLATAFKLDGRDGLMTMDPHGEAQRERWQEWRRALDAQAFSDAEKAEILAAANATFEWMYAMMEGLERPGAGA